MAANPFRREGETPVEPYVRLAALLSPDSNPGQPVTCAGVIALLRLCRWRRFPSERREPRVRSDQKNLRTISRGVAMTGISTSNDFKVSAAKR